MTTTSINIPEQMNNWISQKVASGDYNSASEVFREAIRMLKARDELNSLELEFLRQKVRTGVYQADNGQYSSRDIKQIISDNPKI